MKAHHITLTEEISGINRMMEISVGSNFEDAECDVVLKLGKLLGSYVPKRRHAIDGVKTRAALAHVALRAPLALIANTVLRITGYAEFTRRLAPQVSVAARHALAISAVGVYEVLSGGSCALVVKDRHGHVVTSRAKAHVHSHEP